MKEIEIIQPDDWHVHFRDNDILKSVVPETTRQFARAIVMPNLSPPILNGKEAVQYRKRIEKAVPKDDKFLPLITIYLTEKTDSREIEESYKNGFIFAAKLYPAGATTNSESGVKNIHNIMPLLETMARIGMPLLIHGEVTSEDIDFFDRERIFLETTLDFICKELPELKITLEHITTKDSVSYIKNGNSNLAGSITPHHLTLNRNAIFSGGLRPHYYCLPLIKRETHRLALVKAAISGSSKFFLGTDTAPHFVTDKESDCGCAGIFNTINCISILAQVFDNEKSISRLEKFISKNGCKHYNLNTNKKKLKLLKSEHPLKFDKFLYIKNNKISVFEPNFPVYWHISSISI